MRASMTPRSVSEYPQHDLSSWFAGNLLHPEYFLLYTRLPRRTSNRTNIHIYKYFSAQKYLYSQKSFCKLKKFKFKSDEEYFSVGCPSREACTLYLIHPHTTFKVMSCLLLPAKYRFRYNVQIQLTNAIYWQLKISPF